MICVLSGGTGTPKLLHGVKHEDMGIIVNTGEDVWVSGMLVSPDLDTVVYTLAGLIDDTKWYGQKNDTYYCYEMMKKLGYCELLKIGDKDRGLKVYRTLLLEQGLTLSEATQKILDALHVTIPVFPMSDDPVVTQVFTDTGQMTFHEFWVVKKAQVFVTDIKYAGAENASSVPDALQYMKESDVVLVGPSNPVTSIGPILSIQEYVSVLKQKKVVGISPMIGNNPFSGPTGVLLQGLGYETTCVGVAKMYTEFLDYFIIHTSDSKYIPALEELGITVYVKDIVLDTVEKKRSLLQLVRDI
ncbi:MAG: 2-phospho-L-lactate transferase [Candidatus Methanofastidiosia archaeon]|jgi:LPPG:FO 2-phospho-L-lactate transferase